MDERARIKLGADEEAFGLMFQQQSAVMLLVDPISGEIVNSNNAASGFYGYPAEQLCSMNITDLKVLSLEEEAKQRLRELGLKRNCCVFPHRLANGEIRTVEVHSTPMEIQGTPLLVSIIHDITGRQRAEAALQESEDRFRRIVETAVEGIWAFDSSRRTTFVNAQMAEMLGFEPDEIIGRRFTDFVLEDDLDTHEARMRARASGKQERYEQRFRCRDGEAVWCHVSATPLIDLAGKFAGSFGMFTDITERKIQDHELQRKTVELSTIYEHVPIMLFSIDEKLNIKSMNSLARSFVGARLEPAPELRLGNAFGCISAFDDPRGCGFGRDCSSCPLRLAFVDTLLHGVVHTDIQFEPGTVNGKRLAGLYVRAATARMDLVGEKIVVLCCEDVTESKRNETIMKVRLRLLDFAVSHSLDEFLTATVDEIESLTGSAVGFFHFMEPDQATISIQTWSSNTLKNMCTAAGKGSHYGIDQAGVWVECVHARQAVIHNDYASLPGRKGLPEGHAPVIRELVVPISRAKLIKAIIGVGNKLTDYDARDIENVTKLSDLAWDIAERKRAEEELQAASMQLQAKHAQLESKNITLREVLNHLQEEKDLVKDQIAANKEMVVVPLLQSLKMRVGKEHLGQISLIEKALEDIASPFVDNVSRKFARLSPRELEVCAMIRNGLLSKEIADSLGVSLDTVYKFRQNIRRKLKIDSEDTDIATYLRSL